MTQKARERYLAKAQQYEQYAKKIHNQEDREWRLCLARAYRMLTEAEVERSTIEPSDKGAPIRTRRRPEFGSAHAGPRRKGPE
jgi:hypothetical protein